MSVNQVEQIKSYAEENELSFREQYSGRSMYGKSCVGIVCDNPNDVIAELGIPGAKTDDMGRSTIVYWPKIAMSTKKIVCWNEVLNDMQRAREIAHECHHDDNSLRQRRLLEEAEIVEYTLGNEGVFIWQGNDQIPVEVEDPENITLYINVYRIERLYGGPEEGGWWYDNYVCEISAAVFWSPTHDNHQFDNAWSYFQHELSKWKERYNNEGHRPLHSVLSSGEWRVHLEAFPKESETTERPVYC